MGLIRTIIEGLILSSLLIGIFFVGYYLGDGTLLTVFAEGEGYPSGRCNGNMSVVQKANCLERELEVFYDYNKSNVGKELNLDELKEQGGVCSHYSEWYCSRAREIGLYCKTVVINQGEMNHMFSVIYGGKTYCLVDQTFTPVCHQLYDGGKKNETNE